MTDLSSSPKKQRGKPWLQVNSFDELMKHEKEIVERIDRTPNGAHLFLIHPFMLLQDIGVELSSSAEKEIIQQEPHITGLSAVPYEALKNSKEQQNIHFHLHGLFERKEKR